MVFNLSPFTLVALIMIALFIYGPDRMPKAAAEAARGLRKLRSALKGATEGVRKELGPEYQDLKLRDLNPRSFVRRHLLEDETTWQRPEPPWEPGPRRADWPANVPFPSAAEMGMTAGDDPFTAAIPNLDKPPTPPTPPPASSAAPAAPAPAAGAQSPAPPVQDSGAPLETAGPAAQGQRSPQD